MHATGTVRHRRGLSLFGTPVRVNWFWLFLTAVIAGITLESLSPERNTRSLAGWYAVAMLALVGIVASLILHDLAHLLAARRVGHRLQSIDPALLGNLSDAGFPPATPRSEAIVALAGPAASLLLSGVFFGLAIALPSEPAIVTDGAVLLALVNVVILAISMVPGFPYDGGRVLRAFVWYLSDDLIVGTRVAAMYGQFLGVFGFVLSLAALAAGEPYSVWGAWALLFLWTMGRASHEGVERTLWNETARTTTVGDIVMGASTRVDADVLIDHAIDDVLHARNHGPILVTEAGVITGVFSLARIRKVPRTLWAERRVRDVAAPIEGLPHLGSDSAAVAALELFETTGAELVLVDAEHDGRIIGALDLESTQQRLRDRIAAERRRRRGD